MKTLDSIDRAVPDSRSNSGHAAKLAALGSGRLQWQHFQRIALGYLIERIHIAAKHHALSECPVPLRRSDYKMREDDFLHAVADAFESLNARGIDVGDAMRSELQVRERIKQ